MKRSDFGESEKELLKRLWDSGYTKSRIAKVFPYPQYFTVIQINKLIESGYLSKDKAERKCTANAQVIQAYKNGMRDPYEIAGFYNVSVETVKSVLKRAKLSRSRPPHNYKQRKLCDNTMSILDEIKNGKPLSQIAKEHNVSRQYVYKIKNHFLEEV